MEAGQDPRPKNMRRQRHTQHQIQEMEAFFTKCPRPNVKQRKELSRELGLEPLQVKFWFQNKRTQMKTRHEHHVHTQLRNENEKLRADNMMYREALGRASCPNCDGPTAIREIAVAAMEELIRMAQMGEPLWMTSLDGNTTVFNEDEYIRTFPRVAPKPNNHFKCEASRESTVVTMNHINLAMAELAYGLEWALAQGPFFIKKKKI
ncbi:Homeobox-leucine zipper protein HDG2 [Prunus yedoensis var. nudiflora]|uniref:Homeobox-leucine zipper protein HDG2 n=1 Tax=Prunus yedoensis var. nudiflora TaxID=2094558 RepID=A0A314YAD1_PRUYE|nr:Homeobox-leucine zipper protein HDG2 [Prunus yedoensis var. nudiflora]